MHADLSTQTPTVTSPDAHKKWRHPPDLKTQCQHPNAIVSACGHAPHFAFGEPRPRRIAEAHFEACGGRGSDVRDCGSVVQGPGETCRHEEHAPRRQHLLRGAGPVTAAVTGICAVPSRTHSSLSIVGGQIPPGVIRMPRRAGLPRPRPS